MGLNRKILNKIVTKTNDDKRMQKFIINILQAENKGIGRYTKFYRDQLEKATEEAKANED
ncbi:hypothetical protein [Clostridium sp. AWRP]|uniref:hypothetical protein n=1 Tax=Clostridium sp. AWRP TaxID=2212991 RepID=UPI000FD945E1|nr:hypothetical protein [Clostridium sp. AWRP]AZV56428.1 hypothetical protein DMR38_07300 [Clostridium sp. AWRP]